jgi:hypothetical protein
MKNAKVDFQSDEMSDKSLRLGSEFEIIASLAIVEFGRFVSNNARSDASLYLNW